jgi:hypothetical protein
MKLQSGGTSTTLTSIARFSASSKTPMLTSLSSVAAIAMKTPSRSAAPAYARFSQAIEPSAARLSSSGWATGAIRVTSASQASRPSTFSSPTSPPPTTRQRRPFSFRQAM